MEKILVVLSDKKILLSIESLLSHNHYEVISVSNPQDALRLIYSYLPDLIISDFSFPDEEQDIYSYVRNELNLKATPILFFNGNYDIEINSIDSYIDFISKPYQSGEILKKINHYLKNKKEVVSLKREASSISIDGSVFLEVEDYANEEKSDLSEDEIIDAFSRRKIEQKRIHEKEKKSKTLNKLIQIFSERSQLDKDQFLESYSTSNIKDIYTQIAKREGVDGGISMMVTEVELKVDKYIFETVLKEAIENALRHSSSSSPVELIGIVKNNEYVISLTNYSVLEKEINLDKQNTYGMEIIDVGCRIMNIQNQITIDSNNYVKSRFTININNN